MERTTTYHDAQGPGNTAVTLELAKRRAQELGIRQVVVASTHGGTAREAARVLAGTGIGVVAVTISEGYRDMDGWCMEPAERQATEAAGVKVLTAQHALSGGVGEAFLGDASPLSIVADTLYLFSQGMKVAVEIALMAADAGLVPTDREIVAVAGSGEGADTAVVLVPVTARKFRDLRIREILCKPRIG